jgi:hypothetical protein
MRVAGLVHLARSALAALVRAVGAWIADVVCLVADLIDPDMPETIWRPREWFPRPWDRTGGRTPNETRD